MTKSRQGQNQVNLKCRAKTPLPDREEQGPLVADDHGIAILAGRKRFWPGRSSQRYFFAWSDVISYRLTSPMVGRASDVGRSKTHNAQLTIYTRREQYCWELPLSQVQLRAKLERWLAHIPMSA